MKFLLIAATVVAVVVAGPTRALVKPDMSGPALVTDFEEHPISIGPEIIDEYHPIHIGPEIIDEYHPIHIGPEIIDEYHPIHIGPEIIDFPIPEGAMDPTPIAPAPVAPVAPASSPLVQIIVNVQQAAPADIVNPVVVPEEHPFDIIDVMPVFPVLEPEPEPVNVVDELPAPLEPVIVSPIIVDPVIVGPEILN